MAVVVEPSASDQAQTAASNAGKKQSKKHQSRLGRNAQLKTLQEMNANLQLHYLLIQHLYTME